jgi:co-chaperonin GroES (HSP10)|tara:strand:+ start:691 stop:1140 length:450 start_codon:yes stop_codon:yes gene_type:complete
MANTALQEKWAEEEANKTPLEKAYDEGTTLNPKKIGNELLEQLPDPTGWRIMILPYRGKRKTKGGIELTEETLSRRRIGTVLGYVLKVGPLAYNEEKFSTGPWCEEGDWVLFGRYAGSRFQIEGGEIKILNDDEIIARVPDPEAILHQL